jgi:hypothetical protein
VSVFCVCALVCIGTLLHRRRAHGAELGGAEGPAKRHAALFVALWFVYIIYSTVAVYANLEEC